MGVSRFARTVTTGTVTAVVIALAGFGWTPTATAAPPYDESGLMTAGGFADFEVLATDAAGPDWYVELVDSSDTRVQAFGSTVSVSLDEASFTGQLSIDYNVYDDNFALVRASTLTVDVVPDSLVVEGGDTQVTLRWPGLPATVTGARISYGTGDVYSHDAEPGVTTVVKSGAAPWTINDLTNGSHYSFYVTPRIGSAEMSHGPTVYKTPGPGRMPRPWPPTTRSPCLTTIVSSSRRPTTTPTRMTTSCRSSVTPLPRTAC